jgi:hypothetical protein
MVVASAGPEVESVANPLRDAQPSQQQEEPLRSESTEESPAPVALVAPPAKPAAAPIAPPGKPAAASVPARTEPVKPPLPGRKGEPFDPIAVNGPIFVGWPTPKAAIVITGRQEGYMEPCGCAGLDRMKGGMSRRLTMLRELRAKGWPVVAVDVGGIARGFGRQAEMKFEKMVEGMLTMAYDAITFGTTDLRLPAAELLAVVANAGDKKNPFVSANAALFDFGENYTARTRVIETGGMRIGVTGVLGKNCQAEVNNPEVKMVAPEAAINVALTALKDCDFLILLAHASMDESRRMAKEFPQFDVVVTAGGAPLPPNKAEEIKVGTKVVRLIEVGEKGMDAVVLGLYDGQEPRIRYQRVPLDSRFKGSPEMERLMGQYQEQLKAVGLDGLGVRAIPHPQKETNGDFVGSAKCKSCHEESYDVWKKSGHAKAYKTLEELPIPRTFDPECVSCHVTGWHPTKFFPYEGGYQSREKTPHLAETGCECCHGPCGKHAEAEAGADLKLQERLRKTIVLTKEEAKKQQCVGCHDLDNSPDFDFDLYWPHVEHHEDE